MQPSRLLVLSLLLAPGACATAPRADGGSEAVRCLQARLENLGGVEVDSFEECFNENELALIRRHPQELTPLVLEELETGNHAAAWAAGYLGIQEAVPLLRRNLLEDRHFYGWEGPDYSTEEAFLQDDQYPHHLAYIRAIETLTRQEIAVAVALTEEESRVLREEAALARPTGGDPRRDERFCARWLLGKLTEPSGQGE